MIRHIVAWNFQAQFSPEENAEHTRQVKERLEGLKEVIREIVEIEVKPPAASSNRDLMLYSLFRTEADVAAYQVNPAHQAVSAFVSSVMENRVCLDFEE